MALHQVAALLIGVGQLAGLMNPLDWSVVVLVSLLSAAYRKRSTYAATLLAPRRSHT